VEGKKSRGRPEGGKWKKGRQKNKRPGKRQGSAQKRTGINLKDMQVIQFQGNEEVSTLGERQMNY